MDQLQKRKKQIKNLIKLQILSGEMILVKSSKMPSITIKNDNDFFT
jgi:hypothetical protein